MARSRKASNSSKDDELLSRIKRFIQSHPAPDLPESAISMEMRHQLGFTPRSLFRTASTRAVAKAESELGFSLPELLKRIYLEVSNGIDGFGYAIVGLKGGWDSPFGTLIDTYSTFVSEGESEDEEWRSGLLPFCYWGCDMYSCVDCTVAANPIFTYEDLSVCPERYTLSGFFEMWLKGKVRFSEENVVMQRRVITNPFTGRKKTVYSRTGRKPQGGSRS